MFNCDSSNQRHQTFADEDIVKEIEGTVVLSEEDNGEEANSSASNHILHSQASEVISIVIFLEEIIKTNENTPKFRHRQSSYHRIPP